MIDNLLGKSRKELIEILKEFEIDKLVNLRNKLDKVFGDKRMVDCDKDFVIGINNLSMALNSVIESKKEKKEESVDVGVAKESVQEPIVRANPEPSNNSNKGELDPTFYNIANGDGEKNLAQEPIVRTNLDSSNKSNNDGLDLSSYYFVRGSSNPIGNIANGDENKTPDNIIHVDFKNGKKL